MLGLLSVELSVAIFGHSVVVLIISFFVAPVFPSPFAFLSHAHVHVNLEWAKKIYHGQALCHAKSNMLTIFWDKRRYSQLQNMGIDINYGNSD